MQLIIAPDLLAAFPDLRIGIVTGRGVSNAGEHVAVEALKSTAADALRRDLTTETLPKHPYIAAWRETYRRFGSKASDYRPTAEALLRRVLRGETIAPISTIVDLYLAIEMEFYLPIGGYDLAHVVGDITLRFSPGDEAFLPIGATAEEKTYAGEVVYADAEKILTRRWNYRDCDAAKITTDSRDIVLLCEATMPAIPTEHLAQCTEQLTDYLRRFCGGTLTHHLLDGKTIPTYTL